MKKVTMMSLVPNFCGRLTIFHSNFGWKESQFQMYSLLKKTFNMSFSQKMIANKNIGTGNMWLSHGYAT